MKLGKQSIRVEKNEEFYKILAKNFQKNIATCM